MSVLIGTWTFVISGALTTPLTFIPSMSGPAPYGVVPLGATLIVNLTGPGNLEVSALRGGDTQQPQPQPDLQLFTLVPGTPATFPICANEWVPLPGALLGFGCVYGSAQGPETPQQWTTGLQVLSGAPGSYTLTLSQE